MSEISAYQAGQEKMLFPQHLQEQEASLEMLSKQAYANSLDKLAVIIPEVDQRREELTAAGSELIDTLGIKAEFFDDTEKSAIFASLAGNYAEVNTSDKDNSRYRKQNYLANAALLLTKDFATKHTEITEGHEEEVGKNEVTDDYAESVYNEFTDKPTTHRLIEKVKHEGYLNDLADKLGTEGEPTNAVTIHVLNIGKEFAHGDFDYKGADMTHQEASEWSAMFAKNTDAFAAAMVDKTAKLAAGAAGFAVDLHDHEHFMIPRPSAEVLLAKEDGVELSDSAKQWKAPERIVSTLRHEFVHTQKGVRIGRDFGIALEERRAEYLSGDKGEYFDVKKTFNELKILTGTFIGDVFDKVVEKQKNHEEVSLYAELGKTYGLNTVLSIATARPGVYVPFIKGELAKEMYEYSPKLDEISRDYALTMTPEQKEAAKVTFAQVIKRTKDRGVTANFLNDYYAGIASLIGLSKVELEQITETDE